MEHAKPRLAHAELYDVDSATKVEKEDLLCLLEDLSSAQGAVNDACEIYELRNARYHSAFNRYVQQLEQAYVGDSGKEVEVSGKAMTVAQDDNGAYYYKKCELSGERLKTTHIKVPRYLPQIHTPQGYVDKSPELRLKSSTGDVFYIELDESADIVILDD